MKKFLIGCVGVVFALILIVAIIIIVAAVTGNLKVTSSFNVTKPTKSVEVTELSVDNPLVKTTASKELDEMVALMEDYLTSIDNGKDEYIYNNLLHEAFHKTYTLEDITKIHEKIRTLDGYRSYDLDKAKVSLKKDAKGRIYEITIPVEYTVNNEILELRAVDNDKKQLRIVKFQFSPVKD